MIGERHVSRENFVHDLSRQEERLLAEQEELRILVERIGNIEGDTAKIILDSAAVRSNVIDPIRFEIESLEREILDGAAIDPHAREGRVIARGILKAVIRSIEFKKNERVNFIEKMWKDLMDYVR